MTFGKRSRKHPVDWALIWLNWTQWGAKFLTDMDEPQFLGLGDDFDSLAQ